MKTPLPLLVLALACAQAGAVDPPAATADPDATRKELGELRQQMSDLSRRMAELSRELGDTGPRAYALRYLNEPDRAIIGVVLSGGEDGSVLITGVTPDGPAARAGLRSGDVITAIDGQKISTRNADASLAQARSLLDGLKAGQEVRLGWRRDGKAQPELKLAAERREAAQWSRLFVDRSEGPDGTRLRIEDAGLPPDLDEKVRRATAHARLAATDAGRQAEHARVVAIDGAAGATLTTRLAKDGANLARLDIVRDAMPWWNINLASLNPDLGRYFGTDEGVLVLQAGERALPGLKPGDVIQSVAGRKVVRPEDALRALRDQPAGSDVDVRVLRDRKTLALKTKAPEYKAIFDVDFNAPPAPPAPPSPPAAAGAPPSPPAPPATPPPPAAAPPAPPSAPPTPPSRRGGTTGTMY